MKRYAAVALTVAMAGCQSSWQREFQATPAAQSVVVEQIPFEEAEHARASGGPSFVTADYYTANDAETNIQDFRCSIMLRAAKVGATRARYGKRILDPGRPVAISGDRRINAAVNVNSPGAVAYNDPYRQNGAIVDTSGWIDAANQGAAIRQREEAIRAAAPTWEYIFVYYK